MFFYLYYLGYYFQEFSVDSSEAFIALYLIVRRDKDIKIDGGFFHSQPLREEMHSYILEILPTDAGREFYSEGTIRWSPHDAGVDLFVSEDAVIKRYESRLLHLGISARLVRKETGADSHYLLTPRSSSYKSGIIMTNSVGVIDKGYRGELMAPVVAFLEKADIKAGTRLFQIVAPNLDPIVDVRFVDSLPSSDRGSGGFGSTG